MKTLQECKEELSKRKFNMDYREFYLTAGFPDIIKLNEEAYELHSRIVWNEACEAQMYNVRCAQQKHTSASEREYFMSNAPKPEFKP